MLERRERSGEAAGAGPRAARGLPAVRSTLQQCGLLQDLIDISLSNLRGLRTKCAASNDLTQQEIRTLEVRGSAAAAGPDGSPARRSSQRGPGLPLPGAAGACPFLPVPGRGGRGRAERDAGGGKEPPAPPQRCQPGLGPVPGRAGCGSPRPALAAGQERGAHGAGSAQVRGNPRCRVPGSPRAAALRRPRPAAVGVRARRCCQCRGGCGVSWGPGCPGGPRRRWSPHGVSWEGGQTQALPRSVVFLVVPALRSRLVSLFLAQFR